jgi:hypothetical protein
LLTGIPLYLEFAFGMVRDLWNAADDDRFRVRLRSFSKIDGSRWAGGSHVRTAERPIKHILVSSSGCGILASGFMTERLSARQVFLTVLVLTISLGVFGFWEPRSVSVTPTITHMPKARTFWEMYGDC